jgi:hypothetical protein
VDDFYRFLEELPMVESIDKVVGNSPPSGVKIADYFFLNRRIICEVKTLNKDTKEKVEKIFKELEKRPEFPIFYGEWESEKILKCLSDGEEVQRELARAVTSPIENTITTANRQIRSSKEYFGQSDASGIVVIINEKVDILDAALCKWRMFDCLNKRKPDGSPRFESIDAIWLLDEAHDLRITSSLYGPISLQILGGDKNEEVSQYVDYLMEEWAKFRGIPIQFIDEPLLDNKNIKPKVEQEEKPSGTITRQQSWEASYEKKPYLRKLTEEELLGYGRDVFKEISPSLLKAGPRATRVEMMRNMSRFTHLLQEIRHRGLDMRKFDFGSVDLSKYLK